MENNYQDFFYKYKEIRNQLSSTCDQLHYEHKEHTLCKKGCSDCCMNFDILPIEFHSIISEIKSIENVRLNNSNEGCLFLVNGQCTIYESRPSICRSHGLPILNMDEEGENWELSFCPLNFTKVDEDYFTLENGFLQDVYNSKLYLLNKAFIENFKKIKYNENELVEMRKLKDFL